MILFKIRTATLTDCAALAQLDTRCNPSAWSETQFQAACQSSQDTVLLSENQSGELCGFIVWKAVLDEMELHLIATAPEFRQQHVASDLLAQMFQAAAQQKISRILLEVRAGNESAQQLYQKYDFVAIARRKRYYNDMEDAVIMEKKC